LINVLFNGEKAYKDLEKLVLEIGPRPVGSKAETHGLNTECEET
jgi:hypothetical protein